MIDVYDFTYIYRLFQCGIGDGGMKLLSTCMEKMVNLKDLKYVELQRLHSTSLLISMDVLHKLRLT